MNPFLRIRSVNCRHVCLIISREEEKRLRSEVESFVGTVPVGIGDVVTFPALQMHSLQHGIRVIEFQTPHYERLILMFAQKVLTQDHWDTGRALELMSSEAYRIPEAEPLEKGEGFFEEKIVDFPDFTVDRVLLESGADREHHCGRCYLLIIVVSGRAVYESRSGRCFPLEPEAALFVPAAVNSYRIRNSGGGKLVFLRAVPKSL